MPSSMPLDQLTPRRTGFAFHHERRWRARHVRVPVIAGEPPGEAEYGQMVMARELPHLLDIAWVGRGAEVDLERTAVVGVRLATERVE